MKLALLVIAAGLTIALGLFALSFVKSPIRVVYCHGNRAVVDREQQDGTYGPLIDSRGGYLTCPTR